MGKKVKVWTHAQLVELAGRWLRGNGYAVVVT